ncbi:MAG TPA: hypothetical protein DEW46_15100 [Verrucomicrobia bacterium]|jgi:hypothetical protein|nr:hypothetical protein [Verrucomicrobiota bacterium]
MRQRRSSWPWDTEHLQLAELTDMDMNLPGNRLSKTCWEIMQVYVVGVGGVRAGRVGESHAWDEALQ